MQNDGPTDAQLAKGRWTKPKYDRKTAQASYRKESVLERMKISDERKAAGLRLLRHKQGAEGADVRWHEAPTGWQIPGDEFRIHVHGRELRAAQRAVGSPLTWKGLLMLIDDNHELYELGAMLGRYSDKASATAWAHGLLSSGLDTLALHWGLIRKPPD